jgi:hypothetical protein
MRTRLGVFALGSLLATGCSGEAPLAGSSSAAASSAMTLFVDAANPAPGDGSAANPYATISAALARAREIRRGGVESALVVRVAPGTYSGSLTASGPRVELLPLVLDIENLELAGSTRLALDAAGLPTDTVPGSETVLTMPQNDPPPPAGVQSLIFVGPTVSADGVRETGNAVTIDGLLLDGNNAPFACIFIDRAAGVHVRANAIRHTLYGVWSRLSMVEVAGNLVTRAGHPGISITGGSAAFPASGTVIGNRLSNVSNCIGIASAAEVGIVPSLGNNGLSVEPLQTVYDLDDPADAKNLPNTNAVTVTGNDASNCSNSALHFAAYALAPFQTASATQPISSHITATVTGNAFHHNSNFGVFVGAFVPANNPRDYTATADLTFADNQLSYNSDAAAFFGFTAVFVEAFSGNSRPKGEKYLVRSTVRATASDDELAGFGYDNPAIDPNLGTPLDNALTVNGVSVAGSTR